MADTAPFQLGYLFVGHGTRDPIGQAEFLEVVRRLSAQLEHPVAGGFLELATPTIAQGLAALHALGVQRVVVVPLLLFAAGHAKQDVPGEVANAAADLEMEIVGQSGALELQPRLLELSRLRFWQAAGSEIDLSRARLLMVGRGGSDPAALDTMRRYTEALSVNLCVRAETAFVALARPSLSEALQGLANSDAAQVVIQPHLLFEGEVLQSIDRQVNEARAAFPHVEWLLSKHLGPDSLLIEAIADRIHDWHNVQ